jgi:hypothetical protein
MKLFIALLILFPALAQADYWIRDPGPKGATCKEFVGQTIEQSLSIMKEKGKQCAVNRPSYDLGLYIVACGKQMWVLTRTKEECEGFNKSL